MGDFLSQKTILSAGPHAHITQAPAIYSFVVWHT